MLKVALLCHFPPVWFERYGVEFDHGPVAGEIQNSAFAALEGLLAEGLAESGKLDLHVVTVSKAVRRDQVVPLAGGACLHVLKADPISGMPVGWRPRRRRVQRLLDELAPDVVHGIRNMEGYGWFAVKSGYPSVITPQEFLAQVPRSWLLELPFRLATLIEGAAIRKARWLVATTGYVERWLTPRNAQARIFRIPNIAGEPFYHVTKAARPAGVLYVGRIAPEKGLLDLLKALQAAAARGRRIEAHVIGGASGVEGQRYYEQCQDFARECLAQGQVTFAGWQSSEEVARRHASSALFVMPSRAGYETMGIVLAEALAAGTPAVVYDFGPMPDMIEHGKTGMVVPAGDVGALADAIVRLLEDDPAREAMSGRARRESEVYRKTAVIDAHLRAYEAIGAKS